jgi:hypothetical protein
VGRASQEKGSRFLRAGKVKGAPATGSEREPARKADKQSLLQAKRQKVSLLMLDIEQYL